MNQIAFFASVMVLLGSPVMAKVTDCKLRPTDKILSPSLSIYSHEGFVHSVFLEFKTDYGDTLPYVFVCRVNCSMDMVSDDFRYFLGVDTDLRSPPETVILITESKVDDFRDTETLSVEECTVR